MLTDTRLRHLKPKEKLNKVNGRDGLNVVVTLLGTSKIWGRRAIDLTDFGAKYVIGFRVRINTIYSDSVLA